MQTAFLPDGSSIILDNLIGFKASGQLLIFEKADGSQRVYAATAPDSAAYMITQLQTFVATANLTATIAEISLAWTSVVPSSVAVGASIGSETVNGSGFLASGINSMKFDDGSGHVFTIAAGSGLNIASDIKIQFETGYNFTPAGTYTLYYSTDNGSNWTTTGKTVTVS